MTDGFRRVIRARRLMAEGDPRACVMCGVAAVAGVTSRGRELPLCRLHLLAAAEAPGLSRAAREKILAVLRAIA